MSSSKDRVAVPTNGHKPPLTDEPAALDLPDASGAAPTDPLSPPNPTMGLPASPAQLAVGFGIVAALIILLLGRRRRSR
jgi:hypothetical protein